MQQEFDFRPRPQQLVSNDYHQIPATEKQLAFARQIAQRAGKAIPRDSENDRRALSAWIDANKAPVVKGDFANYPSSKQVAFAERIARIKHRDIPRACFQDRRLMSKWIDSNR